MKRKNVTIRKLLSALFVGIFCATPLVITTADAAPRHSQNRGRNNSNHHNNRNRYQTFTGKVTDVDDDSFEFKVGRKEYEVHLSGRMPRQLRKGDEVRVYGRFDGDDEIRNANVTIIRSGRNSGRHDSGNRGRRQQHVTITGEVTKVERRSFDMRVGRTTYEIRPSGSVPRQLSKRDEVQVYGQTDGRNKISNANVRIVRSPNNGRPGNHGWNDRNQRHQYRTLTGTVTKVKGNSIDLRAGNRTYKVSIAGRKPRSLGTKDVVRVYGQVHGRDEIRNANVVIVRKR